MSRVGKKVINIPEKTTVKFENGVFTATGPTGTLSKSFNPSINVNISEKEITLAPAVENLETKALWGTYSSHIQNMIEGVNKAFEKKLVIEGIGFKAEVRGDKIVLNIGFSHPVSVQIPQGLKVTTDKNFVTVSGIDKELVGQFTAFIRDQKKPEPYKGKGIMYVGEVIRRKQGKKAV